MDLDTGDEPLGGLVVVEGRNESGKSTFFELLCVLLYGFYPASRDAYPYAPWGGQVAEAEGEVRLESGDAMMVRRRLLSTPRGTIRRGEREEELRNRAVPWVEHVPRTVFRQVFALTLSELAALEGQGWSTVQDRLLGAMGASDLRSARRVVEELHDEAGALWRPSRRGRQTIRQTQERIRELRLRRHGVLQEDSRIREVSEEREQLALELEAAREERERARIVVERLQTLLPVQRRMARIRELEARARSKEFPSDLPPDVAEHRAGLESRLERLQRRIREIEEDRQDPCRAREAFGDADERLLSRRSEIEARQSEWAGAEPSRARRALLRREIRDRERRIEGAVNSLLDRTPDDSLRQALKTFPVRELHSAVEDAVKARQALEALGDPESDIAPLPLPVLWPGIGLIALGLALAALAWGGGAPILVLGSAVCLGVGIALTSARWVRRETTARDRGEAARLREEDSRLRQRLDVARRRVAEVLGPLSPGPEAPEPGPDFPVRLEGLQEWILEEDDRREELLRIETRLDDTVSGLDALSELLPQEEPPTDPGALAHLLDRALREAGSRQVAARAAERELSRLDRALTLAREEAATLASERDALDRRLASLGEGDVEKGLREATARRSAETRAVQLREELERDHPDLEPLLKRIRQAEEEGEGWMADPEAQSSARARLHELDERIEARSRRLEALDKDLEFLGQRTRLDEVDGEILALEEEVAELSQRRDRLWVMSRIVQEAERSIREEHQPAVLREASTILGQLTGGRYDRIVLTGRDGRDFRVRGPAAGDSLPVAAPLSTGTREQVYLALRLAILDQLDRSGERLPLFLDEVLVNWDPRRRKAGLELLARRSRDRQCFFFTCHPDVADHLEALGARRVRLPEPVT
jgi:uncharacterized protein YhaN